MAEAPRELLEIVLRDVADSGAVPWYPSDYARQTGVPRDALDPALDRLRLAGLVRLTDWVQGKGQGYTLTPEGREVLENGRYLSRLRAGQELPPVRAAAPPPEQASLAHQGSAWYRGEEIRNTLLNPARPVVTQSLLFINIAAFLFGLFLASQRGIVSEYIGTQPRERMPAQMLGELRDELGSLAASDITLRGQWWRLLSYCFVHFGILHLLLNCWVLYAIGSMVETLWGSWRFLAMYLIAGLCGGVLQLISDPRVVLGGASGSLCGMLASMAVWVAMNRSYLPPRLVSDWMRNLLINTLLIAMISMVPGVSWAGHLGGAIGGLVVSVPLNYSRFGRGAERWFGNLGVAAVPALAILLLTMNLPWPQQLAVDDPAVVQARTQFAPIYRAADRLATKVHDEQASPFLEGTRTPEKDKAEAAKAVAELRAAHKSLAASAVKLAAGAADHGGLVSRHLQEGAKVIAAQAEYCRLVAGALSDPPAFTPQLRAELKNLWRAVGRLDEPLRESPILREPQ